MLKSVIIAVTLVSQSHVDHLDHEWLLKTFKFGNVWEEIEGKFWMLKVLYLNIDWECWKLPILEGKLGVFFQLAIWVKWKHLVSSIPLPYFITFYSLFLTFFVLEIFKFKDKTFCFHYQIWMIWTVVHSTL